MVINEREFPRVFVCDGGWFHNGLPLSSLVRSVSAAQWIQKFFHFVTPYCNGHATRENEVVSRWRSALKSFRRFLINSK
jgi:hypothetical protein